MTDLQFATLDCKPDAEIAEIRLTRADLHNRFDAELHREFPLALEQVRKAAKAKVLVLSSEGKSFSSGGDFNMILEGHESQSLRHQIAQEAQDIYEMMTGLPCPIISAAQGAAIGLGATILSLSDIVVAWKGAKISDPHVQIGLGAGDGGIIGWSQSIGIARAKRFLLTGDMLTGEQLHSMGLISDLVDSPEEVLPAAMDIANRIARLPVGGVQGTKRAFNQLTRQYSGAVFELGLQYEMDAMASADVPAILAKLQK